MEDYFQGSLLDTGQATEVGELGPTVKRQSLAYGAWVDVRAGWVTGSDDLFLKLLAEVPWRAEQREMYDRVVDVPRLVCSYGSRDEFPDPILEAARDRLNSHYASGLGEGFETAGLC